MSYLPLLMRAKHRKCLPKVLAASLRSSANTNKSETQTASARRPPSVLGNGLIPVHPGFHTVALSDSLCFRCQNRCELLTSFMCLFSAVLVLVAGQAFLCCDFSSCGARAPGCVSFSSCGPRAQLLQGLWGLPRPGIRAVSPARAGRLFTSGPRGKPSSYF